MGLAEFSIKKPVTTVMIFSGVMLFGVISLIKLPQELFPPITYPQLTVFTGYANAAPEEIETLLTRPVEEAIGTVSGLKSIRSISKEGVSLVMGEFDWDQSMDFASLRAREKVDLIKARLPRDASEPLVVPFNPFELPIMTISVTGNRSPVALRRITNDIIKEELEKIDGVASASVEGGLEREITVDVNQDKAETYGVSILEISDAITNANLNYPAGTIKESFYEYLIRTLGEFDKVSEIGEVVVKNRNDADEAAMPFDQKLKERKISSATDLVLVRDVAKVTDTVKERTSYSRYNGKENVSVSLQKQAQVNTMQVLNKVRASFKKLKEILPPDIEFTVIYDQSIFIKDAINGVRDSAWQGGVLAFIVLIVFLANFVSSAIVTLSIPLSVMVTFTLMYFGGLTLNMMSLGGLALGVGMLVDNAIVVIENIFRHRETGESAEKAASVGAEEVTNAVVASTLTTVAVFFPMIFVVGMAGQLFKELSYTVTFSLMASLWIALTLVPLMSCKLGGSQEDAAKGAASFSGGKKWKEFLEKFGVWVAKFLENRNKGLALVLLAFVASLLLVFVLNKELMPKTDQGQLMVACDMPVGTKLDVTNKAAIIIEDEALANPNVESVSVVVGSTKGDTAKDVVSRLGAHQAQINIKLKEKRKAKTIDVVRQLEKSVSYKGGLDSARVKFEMQQDTMVGAFGSGSKPVMIDVKGEELKDMEITARRIESGLGKIPGIFNISDDIPEPSPEVRINVDKDKASLYNISVVDLARVAQMVLRGYVPSKFKEKGKEIDIRVRMREEDRDTYEKLSRIKISSPTGGSITLGTLAKFEKSKGPSEIKRFGQERTITVAADIRGKKLSDILPAVEKMLKDVEPAGGCLIKIAGESEEMKKSFDSLRFALILSIVLVYMIMAAQFESITQPIIILFTVPLSLIGVMVTLFITRTSISVIALLGVIILGGIVVNNAIVLVDYTNLLMKNGMTAFDALVEASKARLRPILMTALTTILGLVPMAIAVGKGAELRAPMAITVMGGLTTSTFLTLFVIPAIFMMEIDIRNWLKKRFSKK